MNVEEIPTQGNFFLPELEDGGRAFNLSRDSLYKFLLGPNTSIVDQQEFSKTRMMCLDNGYL